MNTIAFILSTVGIGMMTFSIIGLLHNARKQKKENERMKMELEREGLD